MEQYAEFISNHAFLSAVWVGLILALIFSQISQRFRGYTELSPAEATMLINRQDATMIDVRGSGDFNKSHILNAINVSTSNLDKESKKLDSLKAKPVILYCASGNISLGAASKLVKAGFTTVHSLKGGISAWESDQLPLTRNKAMGKTKTKGKIKGKNKGKK